MTLRHFIQLADQPTRAEARALGVPHRLRARAGGSASGIEARAVRRCVFRDPRKGEWYLSGAIPEAYRAPNDLSTPYHILKLVAVRIKVETTYTLVKS